MGDELVAHRIGAQRHSYPEWDLNPRSQTLFPTDTAYVADTLYFA
jgi:hypothetical protein